MTARGTRAEVRSASVGAGATGGGERVAPMLAGVPTIRLFAQVRELAGTARIELEATSVDEAIEGVRRYLLETTRSSDTVSRFDQMLQSSSIWVNGESAAAHDSLAAGDELAILPPVSGG